MGLIGKNGAGKTTTLKSILNLVHPTRAVEVFGREFRAHEEICKQEIGVALGGVDFYRHKRLSDITAVTRRFSNWDEDAYQGYLDMFSLDPANG